MKCQQGDTSWVLCLIFYLVYDLAGQPELPYVCGLVVSMGESNRRCFSSFTVRAEHHPSTALKTKTFCESGRPDNTAYVDSCDKHVSRKSVSLPEIVNFL